MPRVLTKPAGVRSIHEYTDIGHIPSDCPNGVILWVFCTQDGFIKQFVPTEKMPEYSHNDHLSEYMDRMDALAYGRIEVHGPYGSVVFLDDRGIVRKSLPAKIFREFPDQIFYDFSGRVPELLERKKESLLTRLLKGKVSVDEVIDGKED